MHQRKHLSDSSGLAFINGLTDGLTRSPDVCIAGGGSDFKLTSQETPASTETLPPTSCKKVSVCDVDIEASGVNLIAIEIVKRVPESQGRKALVEVW
jgi:hypothetical protein